MLTYWFNAVVSCAQGFTLYHSVWIRNMCTDDCIVHFVNTVFQRYIWPFFWLIWLQIYYLASHRVHLLWNKVKFENVLPDVALSSRGSGSCAHWLDRANSCGRIHWWICSVGFAHSWNRLLLQTQEKSKWVTRLLLAGSRVMVMLCQSII